MILNIYLIIILLFILGGAGFILISRKKEPPVRHQYLIKFTTYFFITHVFFLAIVIKPAVFVWICGIILLAGLFEMARIFAGAGYILKLFFIQSIALFALTGILFFQFSLLEKELVLFTFLTVFIFDSFSQITGQLAGRRKILPAISPGKTLEGLTGGTSFALLVSLSISGILSGGLMAAAILSLTIAASAFTGDAAISTYKRKFGVKDFSRAIPGHGGVLDRFDSLIAAGAVVRILELTGLAGYIGI